MGSAFFACIYINELNNAKAPSLPLKLTDMVATLIIIKMFCDPHPVAYWEKSLAHATF